MTSKAKEPSANAKNGFSLISDEKLLALYANMLKCRMLEERVRGLVKSNEFAGNGCDALGQEAVAVGAAIDLLPEDIVCSARGDLIVNFLKGVALAEIFRDLFACANCPDKVRLATDAALVNKLEKNGKIAVVFSGDGLPLPEFWHEAVKFARIENLPVLFVCQSGIRTEPANLTPQAGFEEVAPRARTGGFPAITVDGNDVVAVYRVASEAMAHARMGHGPTLIECRSWRLSGPPEAIPQPEEAERREADDPILNMEKYLSGKGLFSEEFRRQTALGFSKELDAALDAAQSSPCIGKL
jgi:TPP-dependent pyruvate/acetoin dehydrogenase alpha subunit